MVYAGAALDAHDPEKAKSLLQGAVDLDTKSTTVRQKAGALRMLGSAFRAQAAFAIHGGFRSRKSTTSRGRLE
jgi:hypothetical protein